MGKIDEFILAIENEIAIDTYFYGLLGFRSDEFGNVPRPAKWLRNYIKDEGAIRRGSAFVRFFWRRGGALAYFAIEFFLGCWHLLRATDRLSQVQLEREYALAFSARAADIVHPPIIEDEPKCWIVFPWIKITSLPRDSRKYDIFSLLSAGDLVRAWWLAVRAVGEISRRSETSGWELQGYTAFRWFVVRIGLEKLEGGHFIIAEHFDRWAVLADCVSSPTQGMTKVSSLTLVQHGAVNRLSDLKEGNAEQLHFKLKYRLESVTRLCAYDQQSANVFVNSILALECSEKVLEIRYFKPQITLSATRDDGRIRILFVGHPICEELHLFIANVLLIEYDVHVYYKPHPTTKMSEKAKAQGWSLVKLRNYFPEVEFIISYPSTLIKEYESLGVPAMIHPLNLDIDAADDFVISIKDKLDALLDGAVAMEKNKQ